MMHDFWSVGGRGPFEDPNFGFLTVRIIFVYTFCSYGDLRNIREISLAIILFNLDERDRKISDSATDFPKSCGHT